MAGGDDGTALAVVALGLVFLVLGGLVFAISRYAGGEDAKVKTGAGEEAPAAGAGAGARRGARARGGARRRRRGAGGGDDLDDEHGEDDAAEDPREAARRAAQAHQRQQEEQKSKSRAAKDEKYANKEVEREARERSERETMEALRAEQEKAEAEEFDKWKDLFTVENEGTAEAEIQQESQGLLQEFIDHIVAKKVVVLEELAAEFGLRTADAVSRVQALESMGRITGVMDDRGKFIYISEQEMAKVAEHINTRGRIAIADLAKKSNEFVVV
jgi:hypothetical protein